MRKYRVLTLLLLISCVALPALPQSSSPPGVFLPSVTGTALDKAKLTLPADFSAPLNLLILSFRRDQQTAVESWLPVPRQSGEPARVQTWNLPISGREDNIYRWWLNTSMRDSTPPGESTHNIVPLYVNKPRFLKRLDIASEKDVVVLLTNKAGLVLWRSSGAVTPEKKTSLLAFLKTAPSGN